MINQIEDLLRKIFGLSKLERFDKTVDFKKVSDQGATFLDVRTVEEFDEGHIEGAINIPVQVLSESISELKDVKLPILAYCRSGRRSGRATKLLNKNGLKTYNAGGFKYLKEKL